MNKCEEKENSEDNKETSISQQYRDIAAIWFESRNFSEIIPLVKNFPKKNFSLI